MISNYLRLQNPPQGQNSHGFMSCVVRSEANQVPTRTSATTDSYGFISCQPEHPSFAPPSQVGIHSPGIPSPQVAYPGYPFDSFDTSRSAVVLAQTTHPAAGHRDLTTNLCLQMQDIDKVPRHANAAPHAPGTPGCRQRELTQIRNRKMVDGQPTSTKSETQARYANISIDHTTRIGSPQLSPRMLGDERPRSPMQMRRDAIDRTLEAKEYAKLLGRPDSTDTEIQSWVTKTNEVSKKTKIGSPPLPRRSLSKFDISLRPSTILESVLASPRLAVSTMKESQEAVPRAPDELTISTMKEAAARAPDELTVSTMKKIQEAKGRASFPAANGKKNRKQIQDVAICEGSQAQETSPERNQAVSIRVRPPQDAAPRRQSETSDTKPAQVEMAKVKHSPLQTLSEKNLCLPSEFTLRCPSHTSRRSLRSPSSTPRRPETSQAKPARVQAKPSPVQTLSMKNLRAKPAQVETAQAKPSLMQTLSEKNLPMPAEFMLRSPSPKSRWPLHSPSPTPRRQSETSQAKPARVETSPAKPSLVQTPFEKNLKSSLSVFGVPAEFTKEETQCPHFVASCGDERVIKFVQKILAKNAQLEVRESRKN